AVRRHHAPGHHRPDRRDRLGHDARLLRDGGGPGRRDRGGLHEGDRPAAAGRLTALGADTGGGRRDRRGAGAHAEVLRGAKTARGAARRGPSPARRGAAQDDSRTTSSVGSVTWRRGAPLRVMSVRIRTMVRPSSSTGWRTVVSGGLVWRARTESSNPTTATSSGTRRP